MASPSGIYAFIAQLGTPNSLPGEWNGIKAPVEFFDLTLSAGELRKRLRKAFEMPDLLEAGVFFNDSANKRVFSPLLCEGDTFFTVNRGGFPRPGDIVGTKNYCLSRHWAGSAALADDELMRLISRFHDQLIVVPTIQDCAVLRAIGFGAIPAECLRHLAGESVDLFCKKLRLETRHTLPLGMGWPRQPEIDLDGPSPIGLVLANWSVSQLDLADVPLILELVSDFEKLDRYFGIDLSEFVLWKPSIEDLDGIRFGLERGTPQLVTDIVYRSATERTEPLSYERGPAPPQTFSEAVRRWANCSDKPALAHLKKQAWQQVEQQLDKELIEPIHRAARDTADPLRRDRLVTNAQLSGMLHLQLERLANDFARPTGANGAGPPLGFPEEELRQALAIAHQQYALTEEAVSWKSKQTIKRPALPKPKRTRPSSPNSDSARPKSPR